MLSPEIVWELARRWWDDRLQYDWRRATVAERQTILSELDLTGPFWDLTGPGKVQSGALP